MNFNIANTPYLYFGAGKFKKIADIELFKESERILILTGKHSFVKSESFTWLDEMMKSKNKTYLHYMIDREPSPQMIDDIVEAACDAYMELVIGIGGGSVMDAAKAVAAMLREEGSVMDYLEGVGSKEPSGSKIPMIAVPTTSGTGSEATKNAVISEVGEKGFKKSLRHDAYVPNVAIIDAELLASCSLPQTAASGMDALTQLLGSYISTQANPMTDALALSGIESVGKSLMKLCSGHLDDLELRSHMAYGAYVSGITLANAGLSTVHGFASSVGGRFEIPHGVLCGTLLAESHKMSLEYLIEHQETAYIDKYAKAGRILANVSGDKMTCAKALIETLEMMVEELKLPRLSEFGIKEEDLISLAQETSNKNNPADLSTEQLRQILKNRL